MVSINPNLYTNPIPDIYTNSQTRSVIRNSPIQLPQSIGTYSRALLLENSYHSATSCSRDRLELDCELGTFGYSCSLFEIQKLPEQAKGLHSSCYTCSSLSLRGFHFVYESMTPCASTFISLYRIESISFPRISLPPKTTACSSSPQ
jgi:hypothetical protein